VMSLRDPFNRQQHHPSIYLRELTFVEALSANANGFKAWMRRGKNLLVFLV
jgi:hypothetical protein